MNEAEVLIYMLSRKQDEKNIGASENELLNALSLTDRNSKFKLLNLLEEINANIFPFGLTVKFNPVNEHWFISFKDNVSTFNESHNSLLSTKLAATLFSILVLNFSNNISATIAEIAKIRNKQNITEDIEELKNQGYLELDGNNVILTPKIFYYLDIDDIAEEIRKFNCNEKNEENINQTDKNKEKISE